MQLVKQFLCIVMGAIAIGPLHLLAQEAAISDKKATRETIQLHHHLKILLNRGFMFGHQDDLAYGVGWQYEVDRSDIKEVTGDYPAVYGWELGHLELDSSNNLDGVPFNAIRSFIKTTYQRGGVNTISWHFTNALTGKSAWDVVPNSVAAILPGGAKHAQYKTWLNKLAAFFLSLKGKDGEAIPVIFRPFHEWNGSWFWWGKTGCTASEFIQLYQFTVTYLRDIKNVHNLLYAFNSDRFKDRAAYLERFPGAEWVDILGFDIYQRGNNNAQFVQELDQSLSTLAQIAGTFHKIPALTEFGYNEIPDSSWWTQCLLKAIGTHTISYILGWRNAGKKENGFEYYVPYKGQVSARDFLEFYKDRRSLFQSDIKKENLYH